MHKICNWLILFFSILSFALYGQNGVVKGTVKNEATGIPLYGVTVVDEKNNGTATDSIGHFELSLPSGTHSITFKFISFTEKKINVVVAEGETQTLNVSLTEAANELGTVVVSASKFEQRIQDVTVSMVVIKPAIVENKNTTSMDDILEQVPGVNIIDGQANIRGGAGWSSGAGSRVMVLVDDLPELTADASDAKWDFFPVENLEQVEVIKGASSSLFGSSAIDGVINIRTAYPKDTPMTRVNLYSGFYDTPMPEELKWWGNKTLWTSGANFFHSRKINNFDLVLGGNYQNSDGYQEGEYGERVRLNGNFRYRFKKLEGLSAGVNFNHMKKDGALFFIWANDTSGALRPYGGLHPDSTTISAYTSYRTTVDPFITWFDRKGNSLKLRMRYFNSINDNNTNQSSTSDFYYTELQYQKRFSEQLILTAGVVRSFSKVRADLYGDHDGDNLAFFAQGDAKWKKFTFSLGGRVEHYSLDDVSEEYTPVIRTGVNYHLARETYLRASYGQGYRFPSIAEKFIKTEVGGAAIFPNDSLESETGYSAEIGIMQGLKLGKWLGYIDLAAFQTEYHNMIEFVFGQWGPPPYTISYFGLGFQSLNTGDTRIKGLDLTLTGQGVVTGKLKASVLAGFTYMDPRQLSFNENYIKEVATGFDSVLLGSKNYLGTDSSDFLKYRYKTLVRADVELTYEKISFGISMRYNSFMQNIDKIFATKLLNGFTEEIVPGLSNYREEHNTGDAIFDLRLAYQATSFLKAAFIMRNVLNREYMGRPGDIQPPRNFTLQLTAAF